MKLKVLFVLLVLFLFGCPVVEPPVGLMGFTQLDDSKATQAGLDSLVLANNSFAIDYYNKLDANPDDSGKNIFFSPFSISTALAMTYEGADGNTASEMQKVFQFPIDDTVRQSSFARLYNSLNESAAKGNYKLNIANALWNEKTYSFNQSFYDTISKYYYGKSTAVDFKTAPEEQRQTINKWIEDQTNKRIIDLLPNGSVTPDTKMVLTNAIYFKGDWLSKFKAENTKDSDFFVSADKKVTAKMMNQKEDFKYYHDDAFQYLELPYKGDDISMVVVLPQNKYTDCVDGVSDCIGNDKEIVYDFNIPSVEGLSALSKKMVKQEVVVSLPKFKFETEYDLIPALKELGMNEAFSDSANFSKMDPKNSVKITGAFHKAFVEVNEEGTEAAAATGIVMGTTSARPNNIFTADHPFAFYIQDNKTGEILFLGKVVDPTLAK